VQGTASLATVGANREVAAARRLVIICDEIYRKLVHDPAAPVLSPAEAVPERIVINTEAARSVMITNLSPVGPPLGPAPGVSPPSDEPSQ
jgi:aspartate/methionine/tyrosine aminotransferase